MILVNTYSCRYFSLPIPYLAYCIPDTVSTSERAVRLNRVMGCICPTEKNWKQKAEVPMWKKLPDTIINT
jgi:hypothetical protein